jgi:acetyl esterase/lipase
VGPVITRTFRSVDGVDLRADIHRPDGRGPVPAILWLHGGALIAGRRTDLSPTQRDRYLAAGWAVVSADYRLAPESPIEAILSDVDAAWAWLATTAAAEHALDPARLALVGHSAGGYLALARGPHLRPRPRAIVSFYGYGDVAGAWYTKPSPTYLAEPTIPREAALRAIAETPPWADDLSPRMAYYRHLRQQGTWPTEVLGTSPGDDASLARYCPERHVTADHPPTLLLHGDADDDVPVERSLDMADALARTGVRRELVIVPGAGHGFDSDPYDPNATRALDRAVAFLADAFD